MAAKKEALEGEIVEKDIHVLSSGVKVRFKPVNSMTIQRAGDSVAIPAVYEQAITQPNGAVRYVQNPNHPDYQKKIDEAEKERSLKSLEAMVLFGVELVDDLPADDEWLEDLRMVMDLDKYYHQNGDGKPTIGKKAKVMLYIIHHGAKTAADYKLIADNISVTEAAVQDQQRSFRDN